MKKSVRKAIIAGNWKMNKTRPEAKELIEAIKPLVANAEGKVEVKLRRTGEKRDFELDSLASQLEGAARALHAGEVNPFDELFA